MKIAYVYITECLLRNKDREYYASYKSCAFQKKRKQKIFII